jgi:hypothetical protein
VQQNGYLDTGRSFHNLSASPTAVRVSIFLQAKLVAGMAERNLHIECS